MFLLVRNKVQDAAHWKQVFDGQEDSPTDWNLIHVWKSVDDESQVFFLFKVEDRQRAEAYMSTPEAAAVGQEAGVIDSEFHFLEEFPS